MFFESICKQTSLCLRVSVVVLCFCILPPVDLHAQDQDEEEERAKYQPYRDYGTDWRLASLFGLKPEDGVLVGTGAIVYKFGFRVFPYLYRMELVGGLTLKTGKFKFQYAAKFPAISKTLSLDVLAYASELEVRNFYGFGNSSPREKALEKTDFYRVASRQYFVQPTLQFKVSKAAALTLAGSFKHFEIRQKLNRSLTAAIVDSMRGEKSVIGTGIGIDVSSVDAEVAPRQGFTGSLSAWNYPDLFDDGSPYQRYLADLRGYISAGPLTCALRVSGEQLRGSFPFYEAAFLGGGSTLRGYNLNRFSGDASVVGNAELRCALFKLKLLVPTDVGVFVFGDAGRVYVDGESTDGWHADVGGGLSFAPISRALTLSLSVATSVEGVFLNGGFGFSF